MLLIVQLVQITRGLTTYEAMSQHKHGHDGPPAGGEALTTFLTTGTTSLDAAGLTSAGRGPDPAAQPAAGASTQRRQQGCLKQWQHMLGIDTFLATAMHGSSAGGHSHSHNRRQSNPFSRGWIQNFKDFFCDSSPVFGNRAHGEAFLGGETVDYTQMYDVPLGGVGTRRRGGMEYAAVAPGDEDVV
jgi:palmitoyltransferase